MAHGQVLPSLEYIPVKTKRCKPKHRGSVSSLLHTSFSHSLVVLPAIMPRITSLHGAGADLKQSSWTPGRRTGDTEPDGAVCASVFLNKANTAAACKLGFSGSSPAR